ncbi:MAG: hypothetical protein OXP36_06150 [Gammaproteobacteria bacterium]|nr:hypothetical protein [Gammaproteobacteria bacterium]
MELLGHVAHRRASALAHRCRSGALLVGVLLTALATGEAVGQPGGLFREVTPAAAVAAPDLSVGSDSIALRRRLVTIDFAQLAPPADTAATALGGAEAVPLNLFDDASFTGLVQSVAPTFSGGYSLSGPLAGVELGTMTLVVNGTIVAGTVRTPEATYRIRPAGAEMHAVSQVDPLRLPALGEPVPGPRWEEEERPPLGPDRGPPAPVGPPLAPPVPGAYRAAEHVPSSDARSIETDRAALEALYDATDGENWTESTNWKSSAPLDEWHGVTMGLGRVWGLDLSANGLAGSLPSALGNLTTLRLLRLAGNSLTGAIPSALGSLVNLEDLSLGWNDLTGPIPDDLGNLTNLRFLDLRENNLTGTIPAQLGKLVNLQLLWLADNWGLTGPLPSGLQSAPLRWLNIFVTQACAPSDWKDRLKTIHTFLGKLCGRAPNVMIDVAVVYTQAAREALGEKPAIEALIDLMIAETNSAYQTSDVHHRLTLVAREEVAYAETGDSRVDIARLIDPDDGHLDEAHALRDRVGADLLSLVVGDADSARGERPGAFSLVSSESGGETFAHELGHNMGLLHDRYAEYTISAAKPLHHPAYGYVNQRAFGTGPESSRWLTVMAYQNHCGDVGFFCQKLLRFSNPRQTHNGDPTGIPYGTPLSGFSGPADAAVVLNNTGPAVSLWRDRRSSANRPPAAVGTLPDRRLSDVGGTLRVDASRAFVDPDGEVLRYSASSAAPDVVTVMAADAHLTLTAVSEGTAAIRVTATDPGGLSASQSFSVTVVASVSAPFTDDPIRPGVTPVRAVHFTELRTRIDGLRTTVGLGRFAWTDPVLTAGVTPVRLVHLLQLRAALAAAYAVAGRTAPRWTDPAPAPEATSIRAAHLMELRAAVVALE